MANYDRGVYEPSDEVRVFDGSEEEDDVEGSRLPLLIVLALLVLAMFGGVVWLAYTQGVARGRGETPVLTAASGPERVAPPQGSGGNTVPYQGFKIYEQPAPPDDSADNAPPAKPVAPPVVPKPAPVAAVPQPAPVTQAPKPAPPAPKVAAAPPKPTPAPVAKPAAAAPPKSVAALIQQANSAPVATEAAKPAASVKQPPAPVGGPATAAPRQLGAAASPAPAAKAAASGGYVLQIGAYKSQADADAAWKVYKAKHAALLSAYSDDVQQADLGEKGTWYRLRIGGFADKDMATSLCDRLKADGGVCMLGR
jgi:hypothetical protein